YFELLFKNGERITTSEDDLVLLSDPISLLKVGNLSSPLEFYTKLMDSRLEANLTENTLISSTNYKIQPLPHQLLTVNFVINRFQPRCLIADEVGLGKTIEAILVYEEYKLRGMVNRAIIIVPSGLVLQWQEELLSKFNENFIIFSKEYIRTLKQSYGEETNVWKLHNKILVSIDSIKPYRITKDLDPIEKQRREWHNKNIFEDIVSADFDIAIFDEAHRLTKKSDGSETSRFKLGKELSEAIPIFLLLTATPHQGDEDLFIHLMRLIDPVMFGDKDMLTPELVQEVSVRNKKRAVVDFEGNLIFKHRITSIIEINRDAEANKDELELYQLITEYTEHYYNLAKKGNNQLMMLLVMLYQRINSSSSFAVLDTLKRRKQFLQGTNEKFEGVLTDLDFEVEDQEIILKTITESKKDLEKELFFIDQCILIAEKLTLTYTDKKFESLITIIEEITKREKNPSLKFIVFTEFRATQDALIQYLDNFGYSSAFINGSLSREERKEQIEDFRKHKQFLISTDAGGEGINLQFCSCIINFDLPWNPSRLEQRIGRIDRIGQDKNVLIFNFHLKDSVEDRVRSILEEKLNLIKEQFGEDKFTDIISLLQDEFSFERIYADALQIKEKESKKLIKQAEQIYQRAQEIIESEDLLIPFTANEQNPNELLNSDSNKIIKSLVISYLKSNEIEIHRYKENKELCFFDNPFHTRKNNIHTYRNVTFENSETYKAGQVEFINVEHPLL
ncbi:DEAD/DEAH box helicase, partial [archaeon]|nr:DEAD/DEAH box helicase [archaeon]